ncbi:MAG: hypothetical protein IH823_09395, partial [Candidatus Dadabacteria bacterium]|nr:hypothetical protein [Candidatus Dadabacteria bacterium]
VMEWFLLFPLALFGVMAGGWLPNINKIASPCIGICIGLILGVYDFWLIGFALAGYLGEKPGVGHPIGYIIDGYESGDKKPHLQNLKGSGSLEESGDVVLLIHWPFLYESSEPEGEVHITVAKNRHGRTGKITLKFDPNNGKYSCDNKSDIKSASKENS